MISIVVPAYNEEDGIEDFITSVLKDANLREEYEIIVVNDGSTDHTKEIIEKYAKKYRKIKPLSYVPNQGLGHALRTGIRKARGRIIITMDSDGSHPPAVIHTLITQLDQNKDLVIGSRYLMKKKNVKVKRYLLSRLTNYFTRMVTATGHVKDVTSGFRAYKASTLKRIATREKGFEVEIEILVKLLKNHAKVKEIPIPLINRKRGESKFKVSKHGPRYCFSLLRIFLYRWL